MVQLLEQKISCPYCGESIWVLIEGADEEQEYIEDCQVCCRPIVISVYSEGDGGAGVNVRTENE